MSAIRFMSSRSFWPARTLISIQLALDVLGLRQIDHLHHLDQLVQLLGDLLDTSSEPLVTMVMRDIEASSVGATVRVSML